MASNCSAIINDRYSSINLTFLSLSEETFLHSQFRRTSYQLPNIPMQLPTNGHIKTTEDQKSCTEFLKMTATPIDSTPKFDGANAFERTIPRKNNHRNSPRSKSSSKNALPKGPGSACIKPTRSLRRVHRSIIRYSSFPRVVSNLFVFSRGRHSTHTPSHASLACVRACVRGGERKRAECALILSRKRKT